jgi:hypothetical protein
VVDGGRVTCELIEMLRHRAGLARMPTVTGRVAAAATSNKGWPTKIVSRSPSSTRVHDSARAGHADLTKPDPHRTLAASPSDIASLDLARDLQRIPGPQRGP